MRTERTDSYRARYISYLAADAII
eukprot:SAG31_NODE_28948_length_403_cov_0.680921_1_plen_23_part_10